MFCRPKAQIGKPPTPRLPGTMRKRYKTRFRVTKRVLIISRNSKLIPVSKYSLLTFMCRRMVDRLLCPVTNWPNHQPTTSDQQHRIPSLFSVYLPFRTQHRLLVKVQTILEQACFEFGQCSMPDVLQTHRWECPESCELNLWAAEFLGCQSTFSRRGIALASHLQIFFAR